MSENNVKSENIIDNSSLNVSEAKLAKIEGSRLAHYPTDEHGCLQIDNEYTGPMPRKYEGLSQKNTDYKVDENGTLTDAASYTGPRPQENAATHKKNNTNYMVSSQGTFSDDDNIYTGPVPNESEEARNAQKLYDAKGLKQAEKYEELKIRQRKNLRHAGYKYKPIYTVYTNS